jgi:hypothetical protein
VFQEVPEDELGGDEVQRKELYCLQNINDFLPLDPSQTANQSIGIFSFFQFVL